VGFDKLMGVDVLYCADPSMAYRMSRQPYLHLFPRYRTFRYIEKSLFARGAHTAIIHLSDNQVTEYQSAWRTEHARMIVIPPTLSPARQRPEYRTRDVRHKLRAQLGFAKDHCVWLSIGVQPMTKGTDRTVEALKRFPDARLLIAGLTETDRNSLKLAERARRLGVSSRIIWLGHREDVPHLMSAADLLIHPARYDTTGTVILESIVNGLPVIATAACGYAQHVEAAHAGIVIREPFDFSLFLAALQRAMNPALRHSWSLAGQQYGHNPTLYEGRGRAAEIIVQCGYQKLANLNRESFDEYHSLQAATNHLDGVNTDACR